MGSQAICEKPSTCCPLQSPFQLNAGFSFPPVKKVWCLHWTLGKLHILSESQFLHLEYRNMNTLADILSCATAGLFEDIVYAEVLFKLLGQIQQLPSLGQPFDKTLLNQSSTVLRGFPYAIYLHNIATSCMLFPFYT